MQTLLPCRHSKPRPPCSHVPRIRLGATPECLSGPGGPPRPCICRILFRLYSFRTSNERRRNPQSPLCDNPLRAPPNFQGYFRAVTKKLMMGIVFGVLILPPCREVGRGTLPPPLWGCCRMSKSIFDLRSWLMLIAWFQSYGFSFLAFCSFMFSSTFRFTLICFGLKIRPRECKRTKFPVHFFDVENIFFPVGK